jgi:lactate dehydrogenase-like 2-hydroxyacid dehydrogenase
LIFGEKPDQWKMLGLMNDDGHAQLKQRIMLINANRSACDATH